LRTPTPMLFAYTTLFRSKLLVERSGNPSGVVVEVAAQAGPRSLTASAEGPVGAGPGKSGQIWMQAFKQNCVHLAGAQRRVQRPQDRKSTRLNSSHVAISY